VAEQAEVTYADWGEDDWALSQFPQAFQGYACEVGAFDGKTHSQTLLLEQHGWTCLCIEPNPIMFKKLKKLRPFVMECACAAQAKDSETFYIHEDNQEAHSALKPITDHPIWHPKEGARILKVPVRVKTLDSCLNEANFRKLDFLSIDVEGGELDVLEGFSTGRWHPKLIIAESWNKQTPITPYLSERGYRLIRRSGVNNVYERTMDANGIAASQSP
jgi:FkbM family methyltransferase